MQLIVTRRSAHNLCAIFDLFNQVVAAVARTCVWVGGAANDIALPEPMRRIGADVHVDDDIHQPRGTQDSVDL